MANPLLFLSRARRADAANREGAPAYRTPTAHALLQLASTGCFAGTFYAEPRDQLDTVLALAAEVDTPTLARTALHARQRGYMKDAPAALLAVLATRDGALFERIFDRVVDTPRMLRTFVQIVRSGATGRASLGSRPRRCVRRWLARASDEDLVRASVGRSPSIADVLRMVHPAPSDEARSVLYGWLLGREVAFDALPPRVRAYEAWKSDVREGRASGEPPDVPFQMLAGLGLDRRAWTTIAKNARWHATRMNLNTFLRHGVFADDRDGRAMAHLVADRLRDPEAIRRARVFPYQLLAAHRHASERLPGAIREALHDAMEVAVSNVPALEGRVVVCPDVSGSMSWPVTGARPGASSAVRCVDVSALVAAAVLRMNREARVLPFEDRVVHVRLDPRDTILTNAGRLAAVGGGGTALGAPFALLDREGAPVDLVIVVSDNQSWSDTRGAAWGWSGRGETPTAAHWARIRRRNPGAKLVLIDIQPYGTTQAPEREDVLNIGGFSDHVFDLIADFTAGRMGPKHWQGVLDAIDLDAIPAPAG